MNINKDKAIGVIFTARDKEAAFAYSLDDECPVIGEWKIRCSAKELREVFKKKHGKETEDTRRGN